MPFKNYVSLVGTVESIDLTKRDVVVITSTPVKNKPVKTLVHFWKTAEDGDDPAWANRPSWKDKITTGMIIAVEGHLGNNGRIIAEGFADPSENGSIEDEETPESEQLN